MYHHTQIDPSGDQGTKKVRAEYYNFIACREIDVFPWLRVEVDVGGCTQLAFLSGPEKRRFGAGIGSSGSRLMRLLM